VAQIDLRSLFGSELAQAIERIVDERVAARLAEREHASGSTPWLTVAEAGERLRVSERTIERWLERGRVRSSTIGRRRLLHRDDLDAYVRATTGEEVAPTTPPRRRRG
jgi:excisionase family DNA binding protein